MIVIQEKQHTVGEDSSIFIAQKSTPSFFSAQKIIGLWKPLSHEKNKFFLILWSREKYNTAASVPEAGHNESGKSSWKGRKRVVGQDMLNTEVMS